MSFARFAYTNTATVWPYLGEDEWNGGVSYGAPFVIACGFMGKASMGMSAQRDLEGREFIVKNTFWTEDVRPKYRDRIAKGTKTGLWEDHAAEEIKQIIDYEMTLFNDTTDFEIMT